MLVTCSTLAAPAPCRTACRTKTQVAVGVWDRACLGLAEGARAVAPLKDGEPDLKQVRLEGLVLDKKCMRFEIR